MSNNLEDDRSFMIASEIYAFEHNNRSFNTILFGSAGYLVGAVHGRQYWTDQKQFALRFRGIDAASQMARSIPVATVAQDYFDDAVDPAILR